MQVSQINIYPIKSCGGISLEASDMDALGFINDRRWLVVDEDWQFLTQREIKEMALIRTAVDPQCLHLSAPHFSEFDLPVDQAGRRVEVTIWRDSGVGAIDQGDLAAEWFSSFLKQKVRLVRFDRDYVRQVDQAYATRATDQVGFADGYPCLFISEASLDDLNNRLDEPLPMNRFRPNLVIRDTEPYAEDTWRVVRVGDVTFDLVKSCARCAITTTDQATAWRSKEPLRTLAMYRQGPKGAPLFGQNATHRSAATIRLGDKVEVLEYRNE